MNYGRLNVVSGGIVILVASIGGFALGFTLDPFFEKGFYAIPLGRVFLKAGHTHGMPFAFYNIVIGLLVDQLALTDKWKRRCSLLAVLSFIMPIGLILRGLTDGAMTFAPVALLGALCFLASVVIVIRGAIASSSTSE
ncbi:MAG: hypothetical protein AB1473_20055 [Thermodesulfobacteriota bacterium]